MNKIIFVALILIFSNNFKLLANGVKNPEKIQENLQNSKDCFLSLQSLLKEALTPLEQENKEKLENSRVFQITNTEQYDEDQKQIEKIKQKMETEIKKSQTEIKKLKTLANSRKKIKSYNTRINRYMTQIKKIKDESDQKIKLINFLYENKTCIYEDIEKNIKNIIMIIDISIKKIDNYRNINEIKSKILLKEKTLARLEEIKNIINKIEELQSKITNVYNNNFGQILNQINKIDSFINNI